MGTGAYSMARWLTKITFYSQDDEVQILDDQEPTSARSSKDLLQLALETADEGLETHQLTYEDNSDNTSDSVIQVYPENRPIPDFDPDSMLIPEHLRDDKKSVSDGNGLIDIRGTQVVKGVAIAESSMALLCE